MSAPVSPVAMSDLRLIVLGATLAAEGALHAQYRGVMAQRDHAVQAEAELGERVAELEAQLGAANGRLGAVMAEAVRAAPEELSTARQEGWWGAMARVLRAADGTLPAEDVPES